MKLKEIYKKEKKYNLKLIQIGNLKNNKKKGNDGKGKEVNDDKKTNDKNNNSNKSKNIKRNNFIKNKSTLTNNYYDIFNCYYYKNNKDNKIFTINSLKRELSTFNDINAFSPRKKSKNSKKSDLKKSFSSNTMLYKKNLTIQTNINSLINYDYNKTPKNRVFSANYSEKGKVNNNSIVKEKSNNEEKINLKNIHEFMKKNIEIRNKYISFLKKLISEEIKTLLWAKDFITKLIKELRYDIDDINRNIIRNNRMNISNDDLNVKLKENEKYLNFCTYFYDNCLKGNNKIKYLLDKSFKYKKNKNLFVTETK